jgi:small GTP-binding protein
MGKKIKLCLLGNSGCGKSSIILRIIEKSFKQLPSTVGIDFKSEKKKINNEEVNVEIWDTSGQDRFRSVACNFFKTADGIFLVYDITN